MQHIDPFLIPRELLNHDNREDDIHIIIGENGSGKSTLLNEIAKVFLSRFDGQVIAIANTVHDKFYVKNWRLKALKASVGKSLVRRTLKSVLQMMIKTETSRFYELGNILEYLSFNERIGIRITGIPYNYEQLLEKSSINESEKSYIADLIRGYQSFNYNDRWSHGILAFSVYRSDFRDIKNAEALYLIEFESLLKKTKNH